MGPQTDLFTAAPAAVADRRAAGTPQAFRYQDDIVTPSRGAGSGRRNHHARPQAFRVPGLSWTASRARVRLSLRLRGGVVDVVEPIPAFLQALTGRVAAVAGRSRRGLPPSVGHRICARAPIGWHRDKPQSATSSRHIAVAVHLPACGAATARGGIGHPRYLNPAQPTNDGRDAP